MVTGPIALAYNLSGVDSLILTPAGAGRDLRRHDRELERPGDRRAEPGRHAAVPGHPGGAPRRGLRHHGELHQVPQGRCRAAPGPLDSSKSWTAPGGVAAQGSDGVSKQIKSTDGSIGYVEWGFAQDDGLNVAQIDNGGGAVELTAESAGKAVAAAHGRRHRQGPGAEAGLRHQDAGAYPVILVTYEIVCSAGNGDLGAAAQVVPRLHLDRRSGDAGGAGCGAAARGDPDQGHRLGVHHQLSWPIRSAMSPTGPAGRPGRSSSPGQLTILVAILTPRRDPLEFLCQQQRAGTLQMWTSTWPNMTEHDPTRDERFQVAAQGVPGAMPVGDLEPDAGDVGVNAVG